MKRGIIAVVACVGCLICLTLTSHGESREDVRDFMRAKLKHSQNVLEGLVLSDFEKIGKGAQEMSLLSLAASWQVFLTPDYLEYSRKFRASADALTDAAKKKDLEAATKAYNAMTVRCVECHKYVRGVRMAQGGHGNRAEGELALSWTRNQ